MRNDVVVIGVVCAALVCNVSLADSFGLGTNQFSIDFVSVGNPGNVPDTGGNPTPIGEVDYVFRLAKYELSREIIERANVAGNLGINLDSWEGVIDSPPRPQMPATGVSWNAAARFVNWLNLSQGYHAAYKFATQPGDPSYDANEDNNSPWILGDAGFDAGNVLRNSLAQYFLVSEDEFYKAAYYDPTSGGYFDFPNGSNQPPVAVSGGSEPNTAVFNQPYRQGPADVMLAGGPSLYGAVGLGGNVYELMENQREPGPIAIRVLRGGSWGNVRDFLSRTERPLAGGYFANTPGGTTVGFRVVCVPEPSCGAVMMAALAFVWRHRSGPKGHIIL